MADKYQGTLLRDGGERSLHGCCVLLPIRRRRLSAIGQGWHQHIQAGGCVQMPGNQRPGERTHQGTVNKDDQTLHTSSSCSSRSLVGSRGLNVQTIAETHALNHSWGDAFAPVPICMCRGGVRNSARITSPPSRRMSPWMSRSLSDERALSTDKYRLSVQSMSKSNTIGVNVW